MDDESVHQRMQAEWIALDEAMISSKLALYGTLPWDTDHPDVVAAWDALTRPENLTDLKNRLAAYDDGRGLNEWAAAVTRCAIEVSRARGSA